MIVSIQPSAISYQQKQELMMILVADYELLVLLISPTQNSET
jgi:hypothetical protein